MQLGKDARCLGPGPIGQADPSQRPGSARDGHRGSHRGLRLTELDVKLGAAEPSVVNVAVAAQVILDRVNLPLRAHAGNGLVVVGDRHIKPEPPGMPRDRLAEDVSPTVAERGGDREHA